MVDIPYFPPKLDTKAFNCSHCHVYAKQYWASPQVNFGGHVILVPDFKASRCAHCGSIAHWHRGLLVFPAIRNAPPPNADFSETVTRLYEEAADIESVSPRGAAALLRLAVQLLCVQLGEKGDNINEDIKALVRKGLPVEVQQALDVVRVIGNNAVHPGEIQIDDQPETVTALYSLLNAIAERLVTQPRKSAELFAALPEGIKAAIARRDGA